jgi:hypothetical protein
MIKVLRDVDVTLFIFVFHNFHYIQIRTTLNSPNTAWPIEWQEIDSPVLHFPGPSHSFLVFWSQLFAARVLTVRVLFRIWQ